MMATNVEVIPPKGLQMPPPCPLWSTYYLFHKGQWICSNCQNNSSLLSFNETYHKICTYMINTSATCGARSGLPNESPQIT